MLRAGTQVAPVGGETRAKSFDDTEHRRRSIEGSAHKLQKVRGQGAQLNESDVREISEDVFHKEHGQAIATPLNFHQVSMYFVLAPDIPKWTRFQFVCTSLLVVLLQLGTVISVLQAIWGPVCSEMNSACPEGKWCHFGDSEKRLGSCVGCIAYFEAKLDTAWENRYWWRDVNISKICDPLLTGNSSPDEVSFPNEYTASDEMRVVMCDACVTPLGKFKAAQLVDLQGAQMLTLGEWIVVVMTLIVVSMAVANEIRDIKLCEISRRRYGGGGWGWNFALAAIGEVRTYGVVFNLIYLIPFLVIHRGADAFSMCMNTVAVIFILEIDNVMYAHGLSPKRIEEFESYHHSPILEKHHALLERQKKLYFIVIPAFVLTSLLLVQHVSELIASGSAIVLLFVMVFPWAVMSVETILGLLGEGDKCKLWCLQAMKLLAVQILVYALHVRVAIAK
jgi:hypothetical protein